MAEDNGRTGDDTVLVLGPVDALQRVATRLHACGDLAGADAVLPDVDDPTRSPTTSHMPRSAPRSITW
ncbi:hypothetical protein OG216_08540 [Streptomycetaceae bacterium NBC_01309]